VDDRRTNWRALRNFFFFASGLAQPRPFLVRDWRNERRVDPNREIAFMDARSSPHPTFEILQAYGLGKLDDALVEAVNKHLEHCSDCRCQVAEMAPDSFLARLREAQEGADQSTPPGSTDIPPEQAADPQPETTAVDDATLDRPSPPFMSATGHADATSTVPSGPNEPALQPGTCIGYFGDYELQKVLGEGGMGIVYKARQLSLNRPVALKMIRAARFASPDEVRRFQNETEAVARLDHPHIVPIFEVGRFEDQHYFSMRLIGGESLDKRLKDFAADPRRAARLVAIAAGAVHHAHQRGILHRDLKPANILVDSEGAPHDTDFGLAKRVEGDSELTHSGAIMGTPAYMAPEQASGKRGSVTTSTDVYGLGAILYALLSGRAPFSGATVPETLELVRERPPDPPRKHNSRVPRDLEVICLKCLEKDPRRRYASADALAEDLKRWLAGEPIEARPVGSTARFWMWCRRNPIAAGASGLMAASLVAVATLSLLYARQQTHLAIARKLYADEQSRRADEQAESTARLASLAVKLEREGQALRAALAARAEQQIRINEALFSLNPHAIKLNALGSTLYWMDLFDDAIRQLEEGIKFRGGHSDSRDWVFLALAHERLGHHNEARRWLRRFPNRPPDFDMGSIWDEREIQLLRAEAEARILYDPIFPADPFAHGAG
jgi:tetratricopeptide (TPR) repeat protein